MYPYLYKVETINPNDEREGTVIQAGIVYANCYVGATQEILDYYGEDGLIEILSIFGMEDGPVIITGEAYDAIKKGDWDCETYVEKPSV